jgi:hypothetical protein
LPAARLVSFPRATDEKRRATGYGRREPVKRRKREIADVYRRVKRAIFDAGNPARGPAHSEKFAIFIAPP